MPRGSYKRPVRAVPKAPGAGAGPGAGPAHTLLQLQRAAGNQAVGGLLQRTASEEAMRTAVAQHLRAQVHVDRLLAKETIWSRASGRTPRPAQVLFEEHKPLDPARVFANTAEWLRLRKSPLTVLTPVPGEEQTYFDPGVVYPDLGGKLTRTKKLANHIAAITENGHIFLVVKPGMTNERIRELLIHEVQHVADVASADFEQARTGFAAEKASGRADMHAAIWVHYQKEFRGYWLESLGSPPTQDETGQLRSTPGRFGSEMGPGGEYSFDGSASLHQNNPACLLQATARFNNEKQLNIGRYLLDNDGLIRSAFLCSQTFRDKVQEFDHAEGRNLINSVRLETLRRAMNAPPTGTNLWGRRVSKLERVVKAARRLDDLDRAFLKNLSRAKPFWDDAQKLLSADLAQWLRDFVFNGIDAPLPMGGAAAGGP